MKKHLFIFTFLLVLVSLHSSLAAQKPPGMVKKQATTASLEQTASFKVLGNCGMCQKTIQNAAVSAGALSADWNMETDLLTVRFNTAKTSVDAIQKAVALAGYDNAGYKAEDATYNNLHGCCKYDRTGAAGGTKSCTEN
jgi:hypothetical protein